VLWLLQNRHYTHLSITDECAGCDPNRKKSKFERNGLVSAVDNREVGEGARGGQVWDTQIGAGCVTIVPPSVGGAWNLWWQLRPRTDRRPRYIRTTRLPLRLQPASQVRAKFGRRSKFMRKHNVTRIHAVLVIVLLGFGLERAAAVTYTPITVPGSVSTQARAINNAGQIVGS
jgi:hypothetical protein